MKNKKLSSSFVNAFRGILTVLHDGVTMKIELPAALLAISACIIFHTSLLETITVLLCCAAVLALECLSSAVEYIIDLISPQYHALARKAKDATSGGVLLFSIFSAIIGAIIFLPKILQLFR